MDSVTKLRVIALAIRESESFALQFNYEDKKGLRTRRTAIATGLIQDHSFKAICLCREEPRVFVLERCSEFLLVPESEVLAPVAIEML